VYRATEAIGNHPIIPILLEIAPTIIEEMAITNVTDLESLSLYDKTFRITLAMLIIKAA